MIERFEHFELEEKEYLVDIFQKELREEKREKIYQRYLEAKENREKGNVKIGDVQDLRSDLEEGGIYGTGQFFNHEKAKSQARGTFSRGLSSR